MMRDAGDALRAMRCVRCVACDALRTHGDDQGIFVLTTSSTRGEARGQRPSYIQATNTTTTTTLNTTRMSAMDVICVMDDGHYICTPFYVGFSSSFLQVPCEEKVSDELPLLLTPPHHFIISHIIYVTWVRASQLDMIMKV